MQRILARARSPCLVARIGRRRPDQRREPDNLAAGTRDPPISPRTTGVPSPVLDAQINYDSERQLKRRRSARPPCCSTNGGANPTTRPATWTHAIGQRLSTQQVAGAAVPPRVASECKRREWTDHAFGQFKTSIAPIIRQAAAWLDQNQRGDWWILTQNVAVS